MSDRDGGNSFMWFLAGLGFGALLGVLYAPRSGRETRDMLSERLKEGAERGRDLGERASRKGREVLEDASDYVERTRDTLDKRKDRLATAIEAGRQAYREEKEKM